LALWRDTSWGAVGSLANTFGRMLIAVIVARRLGPEMFGTFIFVQWLIEITFLIFSVGIAGVATRFFPQMSRAGAGELGSFERWFAQAAIIAIVVSSGFAAFAAHYFGGVQDPWLMLGIAFWALASAIWAVASARAQGLFRFQRMALSSIVFGGLAIGGILMSASNTAGGFGGAVLVMGVANLAAALTCLFDRTLFAVRVGSVDVEAEQGRGIRRYAVNVWFTSFVASLVWSRGEVSLIKLEHGNSAVGFYSVSLTLVGAINLGVSLLTASMAPRIMRAWDEGRKKELADFSAFTTDLLAMIAAVCAGFVVAFAPHLTTLLFGPAFQRSSVLVSTLAIGALGVSTGCANAIVQAATNARFTRDITMLGAIALFGAGYVLIYYFGLEGAAVTRAGVQLSIALATLVCVGKVLGDTSGSRRNITAIVFLTALLCAFAAAINYGPVLGLRGSFFAFAAYSVLVIIICVRRWSGTVKHQLHLLGRFGHA
jgi:O-antigen/teichoic acid export membrane protein